MPNQHDIDLLNSVKNRDLVGAQTAIEDGANVNAHMPKSIYQEEDIDYYSFTPLMIAISQQDIEMIDLLLSNNANQEEIDSEDKTALIHGVRSLNLEIVENLLDSGANIDNCPNGGYSALMHAALEANIEMITLLLNRGADINLVQNYGITTLMRAVSSNSIEVVRLILDSLVIDMRANLDHRSIMSFLEMIELRNNEGRNSLSLAIELENFEVALMIISLEEILQNALRLHENDLYLVFINQLSEPDTPVDIEKSSMIVKKRKYSEVFDTETEDEDISACDENIKLDSQEELSSVGGNVRSTLININDQITAIPPTEDPSSIDIHENQISNPSEIYPIGELSFHATIY
jgi:hypothetical protein